MANNKMQLDKNLGQHFLKNAGIVEKIIDRVRYLAPHKEPAKNQIIEVGPGGGALTYKLLEAGFSVLAIELDRRWIENLEKTCTKELMAGRLRIIDGDATKLSTSDVKALLWNPDKALLCGNFPYNRGQEILLKYFEEAPYIDSFVVMLQKEVVDKFTAKLGDNGYGPLAVKWNFLADEVDSFPVSPGSFSPPPKVQSAVLSFRRHSANHDFDPRVNFDRYKNFSRFLARSFLNRRKKYIHALKDLKIDKATQEKYGSFRSEQLKPVELHDIWLNSQK